MASPFLTHTLVLSHMDCDKIANTAIDLGYAVITAQVHNFRLK